MSEKISFKTKELDDLIKACSGRLPVAKVGIMGKNSGRPNGAKTNAEVGATHEFGTEKLPIRSFLRVPITDNFNKYLQKSGAFSEDIIAKIVAEKSLLNFVRTLGFVGVQIVGDAFASGGFGKWKPSNMKFKKNHQTLVETQQLRNSITSEVIE